jgi:hypothetical protein
MIFLITFSAASSISAREVRSDDKDKKEFQSQPIRKSEQRTTPNYKQSIPSTTQSIKDNRTPRISERNNESNRSSRTPGTPRTNNEVNRIPQVIERDNATNRSSKILVRPDENNRPPRTIERSDTNNRMPKISERSNESNRIPKVVDRNNENNRQPRISERYSPDRNKTNYSDIGEIWQKRQNDKRRINDRNFNDHEYKSGYTHKYKRYCYDYKPFLRFPSAFCFYYDFFPPYIDSVGIIYIPRLSHSYINLTIILNRNDDYYLSSPRYSYLPILNDISDAWTENKIRLLNKYIQDDSDIAIFIRGEYSYSINSQDYLDITQDAMGTISTERFAFTKVQKRDNGDIVAYGEHIYYDINGDTKKVFVFYTLSSYGGQYYITEAGSSPSLFVF